MKRLKLRAAVHERLVSDAKHPSAGRSFVPIPALVEIEQDDGGYYLFYLDEAGQFLAHTWHETLDGAKAKANLELAIQDTEWVPVDR